jgi:hypothetical protein
LGLINTLFSARIHGLFWSEFGLISKGFGLVFVSGSIQPTRVDSLEWISHNCLNTCKPKFWQLNFLVLMCERASCILWFLNKLNLIYWRLTAFRGVIQLQFNSASVLGHVSIISHSYQTSFSFSGSDLNFDCGLCDHVIMRFASVGIKARLQESYPFKKFVS